MTAIGPKEARRRELRESQYAERLAKRKTIQAPSERLKLAKDALAMSNKSNTAVPLSNSIGSMPFDKAAYQREYMRKRRAKAKASA